MLSRARALSTFKRSSLGLDLYLWTTCRPFALKRPLRLSWPHLSWSTPSQGESLIPELPRPVERTFVAENTLTFREIRVEFICGRSGSGINTLSVKLRYWWSDLPSFSIPTAAAQGLSQDQP